MPSRRQFLAALGTAGTAGLAGCTVLARQVDGAFPGSGIDEGNTGYAPERRGPETPRVRWSTDVGGWLGATPVVADDRVFLPYPADRSTVEGQNQYEARLGAWDATTGVREWTATTGRVEFDGTFSPARDSLVFHDGALYLVDATGFHSFTLDGERRWHTPIKGRQTNPAIDPAHPVIRDDTAYFGTAGIVDAAHEGVFAVSTDDGTIHWNELLPFDWTREGGGTRMVFGPALRDDLVFVSVHGNGLVGIDAEVGKQRWRSALPVNGPPTVLPDGDVLVHLKWRPDGADEARTGVARLRGRTGEVAWRKTDKTSARSGVQLSTDGDHVYYSAGHRSLRARHVEDGEIVWDESDVGWVTKGAPVVTDDTVWTGTTIQRSPDFDGVAILAADRETGESTVYAPFREDYTFTSSLAVVDDSIYLAANGATLWAIDDCRLSVGDSCGLF